MSYQVTCECGQAHAVTAADAGATVSCGCGRAVEVPPLHQLRRTAGEVGLSPDFQLQAMLLGGEFPGPPECVSCGRQTDRVVGVSVVCERPEARTTRDYQPAVAGCLLGLLGGWIIGNLPTGEVRILGRDVSFAIPLRVCDDCDPGFTAPAEIARVLRTVPVCESLLKKYPHAVVRRAS